MDMLPEDIKRIKKMNEEAHLKEKAEKLVAKEMSRQDSPLHKKMADLKAESLRYKREGKIDEYRKAKTQIAQLNESANRQAQDYLKALDAHTGALEEYKKLAARYAQEGKNDEAKKMWEKILHESPHEPLEFSF
jgi:hypothetical protein